MKNRLLTKKLLELKKLLLKQTEDDTFQKWANYVSKKLTEWNLNLTMENIRRILSLTKFGRDLYEKSPAKFEKFVKRIYNILSEK